MSKRKTPASLEDEFTRLSKKLKRLEKKIRIRDNTKLQQPVLSEPDPGEGPSSIQPDDICTTPPPLPEIIDHDALELSDHDVLDDEPPAAGNYIPLEEQVPGEILYTNPNNSEVDKQDLEPASQLALDTTLAATDNKTSAEVHDITESIELDEDILEILGDDPTSTLKHSPEIRIELASRFQHIATEGLPKESRKELIDKYPLPANCLHVGAPTINLEIKAALTESVVKRDKGIETKQKEMASAISCLTDIISLHLNSKDKNNQVLQKLMDVGRILCDIQHGDSVTRRNFILFAVKNDMQEHLKNTKVDTSLFGENLSDTLKSAKAVNKTGADLKVQDTNKSLPKKSRFPATQPLNRKAAAPPRRPGGAAPAPRGRSAPAAPRAHYPAPQPPGPAYRTSSMQPQLPPRRRY